MDYSVEKNGALDEHSNLAYALTIDVDFIPAMEVRLLEGTNNFHIYSLQHKIEPTVMQLPERAEDRDNIYVRIDNRNLAQTLSFLEQTFRKFDASSPFDYRFLGWIFALAGIVALLIAIVTLGLQAVKAAVPDPAKSLRNE